MTDKGLGYKTYVFQKLLASELYDEIDFSKDQFIFYNSGVVWMPGKSFRADQVPAYLKRENRRRENFRDRFIRKATKTKTPIQFENATIFEERFKGIYGIWNTKNFPYATSFVSLIQPITLASFLEDFKDLKLLNYNKIIFCSITDDADQTDQWLQDYKTIRKFVPNKQKEIDSTLSALIYSPFNVNSKGRGEFSAIFPPIEKIGKPKLFAYQYTTRQGLLQSATTDTSIEINTKKSDTIELKINSETSQNHLIKLDSILVNDELIQLAYPIILKKDSIQKIPVALNSVFDNTIALRGVGQKMYTDDLLGERIHKVSIHESHSGIYAVNSPLHRSSLYMIGTIILAILLFLIGKFIYKLHLPKCIIIGPSGETTIIKNGFKRFEKKQKIQYAGFTKAFNIISSVRLKNHFIDNTKLAVDTSSTKKWIAVIAKKNLLFINDIEVYQFQKGDTKQIQGVETAYHAKIRKKYGDTYAIYFIPYPSSDTQLNFTMKEDPSQNEYSIRAAVIDQNMFNTAVDMQNERMISNLYLKNDISTTTNYILLCNKIQDGNTSLLYVNLIQSYSLKTFLPIQIVKQYKIKLNETDDLEKLINHEATALEKELKQQHQKATLKVYYKKDSDTDALLAVDYPFFPVNLSLCSKETNTSKTQLVLYNSVTYDKEAVEKNTLRIKIERPSDVTIEPYSIQLIWNPHASVYGMHLTDRTTYAINGENYLDIGNPDTITLDVTKNNDQYILKCQGHTLQTNVQDYFYKPIHNE
ncbi:hypothetical protein [uncultured Kordia sp.]|uniref:hypothetical protein n=1 Tax=uncultured Kordia sp. TaxID=507699 RepID=UPI0026177712|nr:hypothetical protein [uncultured Kordia sp.]